MNDDRRAAIRKVIDELADLRAQLEVLRDDEQDSFDNLPEGLKAAPNGQASEAAVDALEAAVNGLEEAESSLNEAIGK